MMNGIGLRMKPILYPVLESRQIRACFWWGAFGSSACVILTSQACRERGQTLELTAAGQGILE